MSRGQSASRGAVSSEGKSRDMMMAAQLTPPEPSPYGSEGYFQGGIRQAPFALAGSSSYSLPRTTDTSGKGTPGDNLPLSHPSCSKIRRGFGSPQPQNAITPFYLPPIDSTASENNHTVASSGGSMRVGHHTPINNGAEASQSTSAHRRQISPPELPSSIQYLSSNQSNVPPPSHPSVPSNDYAVSAGGATHGRGGSGGTSVPYSAPQGYYNPDDPSTYPLTPTELNLFNQPPSARQSEERFPLGSSTFMPRSSTDRLPLSVTNAAPPTPQIPSYTYTHQDTRGSRRPIPIDTNAGGNGGMPPEYSGSPGSAGVRGMGGYGTDAKVQPQEQQSPTATRGHGLINDASTRTYTPPTQHSPQAQMAARSTVPVGYHSRVEPRSGEPGWTPHARNQEEADSEFNPWGSAQ